MSHYCGIDPIGLRGLADTVEQYATRIELIESHAVEAGPSLTPISRQLTDRASELRWRAATIAQAQHLSGRLHPLTSSHWLAEFAACVADLDDWQEQFRRWRAERWLTQTAGSTPAAVAAAFAMLTPQQRDELTTIDPGAVGSLDGAPPELRYDANRTLIAAEIEKLEILAATIEPGASAPMRAIKEGLVEQSDEYRTWLSEKRQILLFDPSDDGRIVEVFGDLESARHIAVVVPGMANDIGNFIEPGGLRSDAVALRDAAHDEAVATIAWLGYDTPDLIGAASRRAAAAAAPDLARHVAGLDPNGSRSITVIAHSYGSVTAGLAAAEGIEVDNLVFVGSPGTTLSDAGDARLRAGGRVWAGLACGDPVSLGVDPIPSPRWWRLVLPIAALVALLPPTEELWHGPNPVSDGFGATRISTSGSLGHGRYFEGESLDNLAAIVEGRYDDVRTL